MKLCMMWDIIKQLPNKENLKKKLVSKPLKKGFSESHFRVIKSHVRHKSNFSIE